MRTAHRVAAVLGAYALGTAIGALRVRYKDYHKAAWEIYNAGKGCESNCKCKCGQTGCGCHEGRKPKIVNS